MLVSHRCQLLFSKNLVLRTLILCGAEAEHQYHNVVEEDPGDEPANALAEGLEELELLDEHDHAASNHKDAGKNAHESAASSRDRAIGGNGKRAKALERERLSDDAIDGGIVAVAMGGIEIVGTHEHRGPPLAFLLTDGPYAQAQRTVLLVETYLIRFGSRLTGL